MQMVKLSSLLHFDRKCLYDGTGAQKNAHQKSAWQCIIRGLSCISAPLLLLYLSIGAVNVDDVVHVVTHYFIIDHLHHATRQISSFDIHWIG